MTGSDWCLPRAMSLGGPVTWDGAVWVGAVDSATLADAPERILLDDYAGERRARLLVRRGDVLRGFVSLDVHEGSIASADLHAAADTLPAGQENAPVTRWPHVTVIVTTRDRAELLAGALDSLVALDYPDFDIVIVDNAPTTDATRRVVEQCGDPRVSYVVEPVPGVSRGRNAGVRVATGELLAFTDDDVVADPAWLRCLVAPFEDPRVGCVSGLVPSGELRTPTQAFFDSRVTWSDTVERTVFSMQTPPRDTPLFPFQVGSYGTGANFATWRSTMFQLGGFDEALGVGTRTGGGEDIDLFFRALHAGWTLVVDPAAITWHRHRADQAALEKQSTGYGSGLAAWMAKVATTPSWLGLALRRTVPGLRRLASLGRGSVSAKEGAADDSGLSEEYRHQLGRLEVRAMLQGPPAYLAERRAGAKARPLAQG